MKYSVIIPVYQCEDSIKDTVNSIQESGLQDFEVIIINDGSTDNTASICQELENEYSNVRYVYQNNAGVSAARNHGVELAKGIYIWFVDADDTVKVNSLKRVMTIVEKYQPDSVIFGMSFDYYHRGKIYRSDVKGYSYEVLYNKEELQKHFEELYLCDLLTPCWNKIIKKSCLIENKIFFPNQMFLFEDLFFSIELMKVCECVYIIPDSIYCYKQAEDEGNIYRRLKRIKNFSEFIVVFNKEMKKYPRIFSHFYYMILRQKIWCSNIGEIKKLGNIHKKFKVEPINENDKKLSKQFKKSEYYRIYFDVERAKIRHRIANKIKQIVTLQ